MASSSGRTTITLNLNAHTISGTAGPGDGNAAGIRLADRSGVRVTGHPGDSGKIGTVRGFDAGVFIDRGSANTVEKLLVQDNVGPDAGTEPLLSDGIVVFNSAKNRIAANTIINNGIYDGIGILGPGSDDNVMEGNRIEGSWRATGSRAPTTASPGSSASSRFPPSCHLV